MEDPHPLRSALEGAVFDLDKDNTSKNLEGSHKGVTVV